MKNKETAIKKRMQIVHNNNPIKFSKERKYLKKEEENLKDKINIRQKKIFFFKDWIKMRQKRKKKKRKIRQNIIIKIE